MDNLFSSSHDPFRQEIEAAAIEALKKGREDEVIMYKNKAIPKKKLMLMFTCLELSDKCARAYSTRYFTKKTTLSEEVEILEKLKTLFNHLQIQDLSTNDLFARSLSSNWHVILRMQIKYHSLQKLNPIISQKLNNLVHLIQYYKVEKSEHTLGHYLNTFVGQKWFPFPFIETLKELHSEANLPEANAPLNQMIAMLDESINALKTLC
jgi:hypothetical protein